VRAVVIVYANTPGSFAGGLGDASELARRVVF
jgi:hypothetical protein